MAKYSIKGGIALNGSVRLGGAKNASFKLMIASLLIRGESRLLNFSRIEDIEITKKIILSLGGSVKYAGTRALFVNGARVSQSTIPADLGLASRASSMFIPVLLHRVHRAVVPLPGGDKIGKRPLDRHFQGLQAMGAVFHSKKEHIEVTASRLKGVDYCFSKNTHTGTETLIMAAVLAKGKTILRNSALEPEIDDLINFLNLAGAKIKRLPGKIITIQGVRQLKPVIYKIMPDRNQAISYGVAAIASRGDVIVENAKPEHLGAFLQQLKKVNAGYEVGDYGIRFFYKGKLKKTNIVTKPYPGFMTDWQPLWSVLATQSHGVSTIVESIHPFRFHYIKALQKMGAKITSFDPKPENPTGFYNFDLKNDSPEYFHGIKISGPVCLQGACVKVPDLRAGATMVLAAICAQGESTILDVEHIDRGYEDLSANLTDLGAKITYIEDK